MLVYCGQLPRSGREVILKICFTPFMTPVQLHLADLHLRQEVSRLQALKHPHVLMPLMVRRTSQGFVLVRTYAPAGSLQQQFLHQPMPQARALAIIRQIGEALQAAHQQGIVHGNLMPNNVLFMQRATEPDAEDVAGNKELPTRPEQKDRVVLTDFYLPSLVSLQVVNSSNEQPQLRHYMAPEQFRGERSALADQYSLAAIAYELFTGKTPFAGSARTTLQHKHEHVLPPAPDKLNPALPTAIAHALSKGLAKNPAERFASIQDFLFALEPADPVAVDLVAQAPVEPLKAILSSPIVAPGATTQSKSVVRQRGTRKRLLLAAVLLALLLAASAFYGSGLYAPLFDGSATGKASPTPLITDRPTMAQQVRIGITATATPLVVATPTLGMTPVITTTPAPVPTATARALLAPTPTVKLPVTPTPAPTSNPVTPPIGSGIVQPILECVQLQASGGYLARFGYLNTSSGDITIPIGVDNMTVPGRYNNFLPTNFIPGRQYAVVQINVSNSNAVAWMLNGSTATASPLSPQC
ncbi:hypothetical protein KSZ_43040 [Dictyobacter formicarum]|uniref:Protein kinase domain-containing protein n=2 Tax=Dictyobacter formicarum TaxID=2778368 RepID=A0ABQ3VLR5_9CHLR|nr:hypothetical protein KSZ_43040 [Dictyobacter formicarum]